MSPAAICPLISPCAGAAVRQNPLGVAITRCAQPDWSGSRPRHLDPAPLILGFLAVARPFRWIWAKALLSVWPFGFVTGIRSSRKLEAACRDQIPYLWLTGWQHPDHNTLWRFYRDHRLAMRSLFKRTVRTAVAMDLVDLAVQAVDGTKVAANASSCRSYDAKGLAKLLERLDRAIAELEDLNEAETDRAPVHLPEELADKRKLRQQVRRAMEELEDRKGQKSINLTDRDARFMKMKQGFCPAYNAQAMVSPVKTDQETSSMLVTAVELVDEPADYARLTPMLQRAEEMTGVKAPLTLADAGYHSAAALQECADRGQQVAMPESPRGMALDHPYHKDRFTYDAESDTYRCPQGQGLSLVRGRFSRKTNKRMYQVPKDTCQACLVAGACLTRGSPGRSLAISPYDAALRRHRAWMAANEARMAFKKRKQLLEPVFGIIKEQQGLRRFLLRGLGNVAAEWTLLSTAFNLRTLWRVWRTRRQDYLVPREVNRAHSIVADATVNRLSCLQSLLRPWPVKLPQRRSPASPFVSL